MQCTRAIPVAWLSSGLCPDRPKGWITTIQYIQSIQQHITSLIFLLSCCPARPLSWFRNHKLFVNRYKLWKLLITKFFPPHCCFSRLRSKYFPQKTIFKRPYKTTGKPRKRKVLHLCQSQHTCYVLNHVIHTGYSTCYGDCVHHQVSP
jgi:hypothetical protein